MKAIAAMSLNRVIGSAGKIPWHLPEDFRWFKKCTMGAAILMGRKTYESLGKPLPGRRNLVVSRDVTFPGVEMIRDLATFDPANYEGEVWVIGGGEVYTQLLPRCGELYLSVVKREVEGDAFSRRSRASLASRRWWSVSPSSKSAAIAGWGDFKRCLACRNDPWPGAKRS
ncbi:MAG: dihydrofolate reductase [Chthoniobacteraceae bacterium]